jgi:hypothetical protein
MAAAAKRKASALPPHHQREDVRVEDDLGGHAGAVEDLHQLHGAQRAAPQQQEARAEAAHRARQNAPLAAEHLRGATRCGALNNELVRGAAGAVSQAVRGDATASALSPEHAPGLQEPPG